MGKYTCELCGKNIGEGYNEAHDKFCASCWYEVSKPSIIEAEGIVMQIKPRKKQERR